MKPVEGHVITCHSRGTLGAEFVAAVVPGRQVTNRVTVDIVRDFHLDRFGRTWPNAVDSEGWVPSVEPGTLKIDTPLCTYKLQRIWVYGTGR